MMSNVIFHCWFATNSKYGIQMPFMFGNDGIDPTDKDWIGSALKAMPEGDRCFTVNGGYGVMYDHPDDKLTAADGTKAMSLWHSNGVAQISTGLIGLLKAMVADGVPVDRIYFDTESQPSTWAPDYNPALLTADPRYAAAVRQFGFPAAAPSSGGSQHADFLQFQAAVNKLCLYEVTPIRQAVERYYPNALYSNFGDAPRSKADGVFVPDANGWEYYGDPSFFPLYAPVWYGYTGNLVRKVGGGYVAGWTPPQALPLTSFQRLVVNANAVWAALRSDPTAQFSITTSSQYFSGNTITIPHLIEMRVHAALMGRGKVSHWAGNDLTADQYTQDDSVCDSAGDIFTTLMSGNTVATIVGTKLSLRQDTSYYLATAVVRSDGTTVGRATWNDDHVKSGQTVDVQYDVSKIVKVKRNGMEPGTSFTIPAAVPAKS